MTAFSGSGGAAAYTYDGNGMRVVKAVNGGTTTVSIFAGSSVLADYNNGVAPSAPSREYVYNPAGGATTGLLAMVSGGATTYYHQDHLSVRLTTDGSGNVLSQQGTLPYGESWYQSGASNKWLFTSYNRDSESGLDYAVARYYDSRTGTFCSADPLAGSPGDPQSWNRYPYGRNDPIDITDPSGKSWLSGLLNFLFGPDTNNSAPSGAAAEGSPGASPGVLWNDSYSVPYPGLTGAIQGALGLPTLADVGGPIINFQNGSAPSNPTTSCVGEATLTAVGGNQARANGALFSKYPAQTGGSIKGGVFGTVAVQRGFLGLTTRQLRQFGNQITVLPIFNQGQLAQLGGPTGGLSVSDYGDPNIQSSAGVAFDIYRFPTTASANQFGKQPWQLVGITFPTASGGSCPAGFVKVP